MYVKSKNNRWRIGDRLGGGGQSTVYEVSREGDERRYALKRLDVNARRPEAEQRKRFLAEVRTIEFLNEGACPNIVSIVDSDLNPADGSAPWFVMPLYKAGPMSREAKGKLAYIEPYTDDLARAIAVVADIARALAHIHTFTDSIHRDVKCKNIFFDEVGGSAVLGDFGIAYSADIDGPKTGLGETLGPARWRPPELRSGSPKKRQRGSDIYQLGGVLYEALTDGDCIDDIEQADHFRHELPELTIARFIEDPRVDWINGLLRQMFRKNPEQRISAAGVVAFCEELLAWSPGATAPRLPSFDKADEAAARFHARNRTDETEMIKAELQSVCRRVEKQFNLNADAPAHQVTRRVDLNLGDPPFAALKQRYGGSEWAAVRVTVEFKASLKRLRHMSYVFVGRLSADREIVGIYDENDGWQVLGDGVPSTPKHYELLLEAAAGELTRLLDKITRQIDSNRPDFLGGRFI